MKHIYCLLVLLCFNSITIPVYCQTDPISSINPENWSEEDWQLAKRSGTSSDSVFVYEDFLVIDIASPEAAYAGFKVLKSGGSAIDAVLTTSLTSITLLSQSVVSYAGIMNLVYYDAKTGKVYNLNGGYNTPINEKDPLSIPLEEPSGRTVLVPGYMAGVEEAHKKFGKIPFEKLFDPAIYFADKGFVFSNQDNLMLQVKKDDIVQRPQAKSVFTKENGEWITVGDTFRQPELGHTLKQVAKNGSKYMYKGSWSERFVSAVQLNGGKLTLEDMANYEAKWVEPVAFEYRGYDLYGSGLPTTGGVNLAEAFNVLSFSSINKAKPFTMDPVRWREIRRASYISHLQGTAITYSPYPEELWNKYFVDVSRKTEDRLSKSHAKKLYNIINSSAWEEAMKQQYSNASGVIDGHTDATIAIDKDGNVAVLLFTTIGLWGGKTMLYVDGVSIPSPASSVNNHITMSKLNPGDRLPEAFSPLLVLKEGKFYLASQSIAGAVHEYTLQNVLMVLDHEMNPFESIEQPPFTFPMLLSENDYEDTVEIIEKFSTFFKEMGTDLPDIEEPAGKHVPMVPAHAFSGDMLEQLRQMGEPIQEVNPFTYGFFEGIWMGVLKDKTTNKLIGASSRKKDGGVFGE